MADRVLSQADKAGMSPGALVYVGSADHRETEIILTVYREDYLDVKRIGPEELDACLPCREGRVWLDICGVGDVALLKKVGELLRVHPLIMEDVANTHQRPKVEFHDEYVFVVMRMADTENGLDYASLEQASFILAENCLVTFRDTPGPVFDPVRKRIEAGKGRLRKSGVDYLMYALLDVMVDSYFLAVEKLSERIGAVEEALMGKAGPAVLQAVHELRKDCQVLRRAAWPMREVAAALERSETELITPKLTPFLRDLSDHTVQVAEMLETQRETLGSYVDLYLSVSGNSMNKTMAFLTVIATIFIPLTFIAGVYGMNFKYMPELDWHYGYFAVWGVMGAVALGMYFWFRRNRWL